MLLEFRLQRRALHILAPLRAVLTLHFGRAYLRCHRPRNDASDYFRCVDKVGIGNVRVARGGPVPAVPEQLPD